MNNMQQDNVLYKSPDGGNVDGHACMHRYISIGRDNRYEHEVTPLGGTRMRIPVSSTEAAAQRSAAQTYTAGCTQQACLHKQTHVYRAGQQV